MKKLKLTVFLTALMMLAPLASNAQHLGVGTNVLGWAAATPNIGLDIGLSKHLALVVDGAINPFHFGQKQTNFWAVQPELRIYPRYRFAGHYIGVEAHGGFYHDFGLNKFAYRGILYGAGLSYGYSWLLSKSWNLEAFVGLGYTYLNDSAVMEYENSSFVHPYWNHQLNDEARRFINMEMYGGPTRLIPGGLLIGDGLNRQYIGLSRVGIKFTYFLF